MSSIHIQAGLAKEFHSIHFIGIAGLMMSSLAIMAKMKGFQVTGSDEDAYPPATTNLINHAVEWTVGHKPENIKNPDLIVLGNHIRKGNLELDEAINRGFKIVSYPEFISMLYPKAKVKIVPAGAHGKSTLTSMLGWVLTEAGFNPTVLIGAVSHDFSNSFRMGSEEILVIEGDEYSSSCIDDIPKFLYYQPTHAIVTSAELDHIDLFDTQEKQTKAYQDFCNSIIHNGSLLLCSDAPTVKLISLDNIVAQVHLYGLERNPEWVARDIHFDPDYSKFNVYRENNLIDEFSISLPGNHNIQNALAVIAIALEMDIPIDKLKAALRSFRGVERRFEVKANIKGITIVEDFAHHPTAIRTTLEAARNQYPTKRIWCVYEPHTYTRIRGLLSLYRDAFEYAQEVIITDIYAAREKSLQGLAHAKDIIEVIEKDHAYIHYLSSASEVFDYLLQRLVPNDLVVFMSVSNLDNIIDKLIDYLRSDTDA